MHLRSVCSVICVVGTVGWPTLYKRNDTDASLVFEHEHADTHTPPGWGGEGEGRGGWRWRTVAFTILLLISYEEEDTRGGFEGRDCGI